MVKGKKQSVLIIDVDQAILDGLSKRFKMQDMLVITAKDGYEGYSRACKAPPDYIVTETLLPSMNGFRIARLLKFDDRYKDSKVILVTTNDLESSRALFESSGADEIIRKPFRFKELIDAMNIGEAV